MTTDSRSLPFDPASHLSMHQELLTLPRETVPQRTAEATRRVLQQAGRDLGLEFVETKGVAPIFLLLPPEGTAPSVTLLATWHAESVPVLPAAVEGAERLALATILSALRFLASSPQAVAGTPPRTALVAAPAASHGSLPLSETLAGHRERLRARTAFWLRIAPSAPARRRVFLGSRGRVVLGLWGSVQSPHAVRDTVVHALAEAAYGPRPLDFELLRKLAGSEDAMDFLEETIADPGAVTGEGEARLRGALFEPRGQVVVPRAGHPGRPSAWIILETSEGMEAPDILARVSSLAPGARVEMPEVLPWDRIGIHHPAVRAAIAEAKDRSAGPEIWPMAPWPTPSGAFTRALGTPLLEWGIPCGGPIRPPEPAAFEALVREAASLLLRPGASDGSPPAS